jgi:hypothetical protein
VSGGLVELAEKFLRLTGELNDTREAMQRLLLNGERDPPNGPFDRAERPGLKRSQHKLAPECYRSRAGRGDDPQSPPGGAEEAGRDCVRDAGQAVDTVGANASSSPAGSGRADRRRGLGCVGLTQEEVADQFTPASVASARWVKPLSAACGAVSTGSGLISRYG